MISVRIVNVDYYMGTPITGLDATYSVFRGSESKQVPVIRIFGSTNDGVKTCLHVHGIFPYLYIPYDGAEHPDVVLYQVASSLDKAINISLGQASSNSQHVYKVTLVKGIPFYGYHTKEHKYLKIYLYSPNLLKRAADLLQNGAIMGRIYQPHEAHLNFTLQFFIDYNLYGMSFIRLKQVMYRKSETDDLLKMYPKMHLLPHSVLKVSICELEIDCLAGDILNRSEVNAAKMGINPGIAAIWEEEKERKRKNHGCSQLIPPISQPRVHAYPTKSDAHFKQVLKQRLISLDELNHHESNETVTSSINLKIDKETSGVSNDRTLLLDSGLHKKHKILDFNLNKSVYPVENDDDNLINASHVIEHSSNDTIINDISQIDNSIVDENVIVQLSQQFVESDIPSALDCNDVCFLNILKHLEEKAIIEEDSILGSQSVGIDVIKSPTDLIQNEDDIDLDLSVAFNFEDNKEDDDTLKLDKVPNEYDSDGDDIWNQSFWSKVNISQLDGVDEYSSPIRKTRSSRITTPNRSNYKPLDILIEKSPKRNTPLKDNSQESALYVLKLYKTGQKISSKISVNKGSAYSSSDEDVPPLKLLKTHKMEDTSVAKNIDKKVFSTNPDKSHELNPISETPNIRNKNIIDISDTGKRITRSVRKKLEFDIRNANIGDESVLACVYRSQRIPKDKIKLLKGRNQKTVNVKINSENSNKINEENILPRAGNVESKDLADETISMKTKYKSSSNTNNIVKSLAVQGSNDIIDSNVIIEEEVSENAPNLKKSDEIDFDNNRDWTFPYLSCSQPDSLEASLVEYMNESVKSSLNANDNLKENLDVDEVKGAFDVCNNECQNISEIESTSSIRNAQKTSTNAKNNKISSSFIVREYDKKLSFVPQAGTSRSCYENKNKFTINLSDSSAILSNSELHSSVNSSNTSSGKSIPINKDNTFACNQTIKVTEDNLLNNWYYYLTDIVSQIEGACRYAVIASRVTPPTPKFVLSNLLEVGLPEIINQEPFYSNVEDLTKKKEVGHVVLKIGAKTLNDLPEFNSSIVPYGINQLRLDMARNIDPMTDFTLVKNLKIYLASNKVITITSILEPPSVSEANLWLRAREFLRKQNDKKEVLFKPVKLKIVLPNSPGQDVMDSSIDSSISMSPFSPMSDMNESVSLEASQTYRLLNPEPSPDISFNRIKKVRKTTLRKALEKSFIDVSKSTAPSKHRESVKNSNKEDMTVKDINKLISESNENYVSSSESYVHSSVESDNIPCAQYTLNDKINTWKNDEMYLQNESSSDETIKRLLERSSFVNQLHSQNNISTASGSGITGVSLDNTHGFRMSYENLQDAKAVHENQHLTLLSLEVHTQTRSDLRPDPDQDPIRAIFYSINNDVPDQYRMPTTETGIIAVNSDTVGNLCIVSPVRSLGVDCKLKYVDNEKLLINEVIDLVRKWDPDILIGYEIEMLSWGLLIQRASVLEINLAQQISRIPSYKSNLKGRLEDGDLDEIKIPGRILLNVWRLMRHEIALMSYSFENVMYHILHQRIPQHSFKNLTYWWEQRTWLYRWITAEHYILRVRGILQLLNQLDLIGRTSELARLFGIQFYEVLSRGSQFRVESMMLRLAKPMNYVAVSPSIQQRARMRAPEFLSLILEPESRFYVDPVIVLDFQSLYPSLIIGYNYCFSTSLGRVEHLGQNSSFEFGATQLKVNSKMLKKLLEDDLINISPCGVAFVKESVRRGILPKMLKEILDTRLMVKQSMKEYPNDKILQRVLHSRQLGLKLIANVTYGYTAANFSGRMPCIEVGDSVVSKGRETLERAIKLVESTKKWGAKVVYGDTDSLFVLIPGRTREKAFEIGAEIADAVTNDNPNPVKLKLEKIYQPCILQTKKRYVGYMYESLKQKLPVYDAKGIETVRRDGCPAVSKMLEKCIKLLFESKDVSAVKSYVCRQFSKIMAGRVSIQDLTFAREFRGSNGYRPGACVPAMELAKRWKITDKRSEPRRGERVPYVIINGPPGVPLIRLVRSPYELLNDPGLKINSMYYITRVIIPPINRCFSLIGADLNTWFAQLPRKQMQYLPIAVMPDDVKKSTISQYFSSICCVACGNQTKQGICDNCQKNPQATVLALSMTLRSWELRLNKLNKICESCCGRPFETDCVSLDCPVLYQKYQSIRDNEQSPFIRTLMEKCFHSATNCLDF